MKRNIILFAVAMIAVIAFAGSAQATEPVNGPVNSTTAEGQIVMLYLDGNPSDYVTLAVQDNTPYDDYVFNDIGPMLSRASIGWGGTYNATIEMRCSGNMRDINGGVGSAYTNTLRNTTPTTAHVTGTNDGATDYATLMELEPCPEPPYIDLNVSEIDVNPNCNTGGDEIFVNESNEICATIWNYGTGDVTGNFDVCFYDDANGVNIGSTTVSGLLAGQNKTVCVYWTPSSADYPDLSGEHPAIGISATVNATVDCNGAVTESDETNNTLLLNTEVSANGYKSKNFDSDPLTEPLTQFKYAGDLFTGGLAYNVSGRKVYPFDPGMNQTRVHHIDLPSGATVKDARLYIVWYDYYKNPVPGCLADLSVDFDGPCGSATFTTPDAMYTDQKAYDGYDTPKGKYAYNVTSLVCDASNDYSVTVENIDPANKTTLLGGILVVVYEGGDETIQLWWQEGCDLLSGRTKYCSSTTEATATVAFPGSINLGSVDSAELITFVDQGMTPGSNMLFNGINIKTDAWDAPTEAGPKSGAVDGSKINVENVSVNVLASGNNMGFQDTGTSGMQANLAFLVTKIGSVAIGIDQPKYVDPQSQFTINITVNPFGLPVSAVQYDLYYDTSVVWAEWANPGTFLSQDGADTDVTVLSIDNTFNSTHGKISYAETTLAAGGSGILPSVNTPGVLTTIHFSAIGVRDTSTGFNFRDVLVSNDEKDPVDYEATDCGVTIYDNQDPVANASSKYMVSNVASKFQCFAALCACNSHGGDDDWWGANITYLRWDFGDGQYGTSEGLVDMQKHHEYTTWNWNDITGEYEPFIAYLTVRDDGVPQLSNTTEVKVTVYIAGDANGDGVVDIFDAACVGKHWGQVAENNPPDPCCTPYWGDNTQGDEADLNNDNEVDTIDAMIVGTNWNHLAYYPYYQE